MNTCTCNELERQATANGKTGYTKCSACQRESECGCGDSQCLGPMDVVHHQCGGPREACFVPGCGECGTPKAEEDAKSIVRELAQGEPASWSDSAADNVCVFCDEQWQEDPNKHSEACLYRRACEYINRVGLAGSCDTALADLKKARQEDVILHDRERDDLQDELAALSAQLACAVGVVEAARTFRGRPHPEPFQDNCKGCAFDQELRDYDAKYPGGAK